MIAGVTPCILARRAGTGVGIGVAGESNANGGLAHLRSLGGSRGVAFVLQEKSGTMLAVGLGDWLACRLG